MARDWRRNFSRTPYMRVKYTMILKLVGEILTRATVTLGRYRDMWMGCR